MACAARSRRYCSIAVRASRSVRLQQRHDPPFGQSELDLAVPESAVLALGVEQHEAGGVPELVAEVAVAPDATEVEADVAPLSGQRAEREAQRVGAVGRDPVGKLAPGRRDDLRRELRLHQAGGALGDELVEADAVDQVDGVEDVALRLRHLVAVAVAHQPVDVHLAERDVAHEPEPEHDHAGDPEEDDVEAGDQHRGRVERLQALGALRPAQGGERPQRRRVPGVEHVGVARERNRGGQREPARGPPPRCGPRRRCRRRRTRRGSGAPTRSGG